MREENGSLTSYRSWDLPGMGGGRGKSSFCRDTATKRASYASLISASTKVNSAGGGFGLREGRAYAGSSEFRSSCPGNRDDLNTIGRSSYAHVNKRDRPF